jgi:hypothetical protein
MKRFVKSQRLLLAFTIIGANYAVAQTKVNLNADPVRHTIPPGKASALEIRTIADSACTVHPADSNDGTQNLKLFADDQGLIRFHVTPASESIHLVAECETDANAMTHQIELRASFDSDPSFPAPVPMESNLAPKGIHRPALTGDPMLLSERELLQHGYPPRPDPQKAPEAYQGWLRAVSTPSVRIAPKAIRRTDRLRVPAKIEPSSAVANGPATSSSWSAFALNGGASPFNWVMGEWIVPAIDPEPLQGFTFNTQTYSALWIGLDGYGSCDVVQDGTEQDAVNWSVRRLRRILPGMAW